MQGFVSWWGLGLDQTLIGLALLLAVVDFFVVSDLPTHVAYLLLAGVVARNAPVEPLYAALAGVLAWFVLVAFHYLVWRRVLERFANRYVAPTVFQGGLEGLVGERGRIEEIGGRRMARVKGDLWAYRGDAGPGDTVEVVAAGEGIVEVKRTTG